MTRLWKRCDNFLCCVWLWTLTSSLFVSRGSVIRGKPGKERRKKMKNDKVLFEKLRLSLLAFTTHTTPQSDWISLETHSQLIITLWLKFDELRESLCGLQDYFGDNVSGISSIEGLNRFQCFWNLIPPQELLNWAGTTVAWAGFSNYFWTAVKLASGKSFRCPIFGKPNIQPGCTDTQVLW